MFPPPIHNALHFTVNAALELIEWVLKKETNLNDDFCLKRPSNLSFTSLNTPLKGVPTQSDRASSATVRKRLHCQARMEGKTDRKNLVINSFIKRLDSIKWPKYIHPVVPN